MIIIITGNNNIEFRKEIGFIFYFLIWKDRILKYMNKSLLKL